MGNGGGGGAEVYLIRWEVVLKLW